MNKRTTLQRINEQGFTIIEIMVALAISALLIGGITQVFISFKQTDRIATALARMQESTRLANDLFMQDIRHIGFAGCLDPREAASGVTVLPTDAEDHIKEFQAQSIRGWDVDNYTWGTDEDLTDIDNDDVRNAIINSDAFRAQFLSQTSIPLSSDMAGPSSDIALGNNIFGIEQGDVVAVGSCDFVDIFQVTNAPADPVTLEHSTTANTSSNVSEAYTTEDNVRLFLSNTYFVGNTGRTNNAGTAIHALYRRDLQGNIEEVVEGVENMQVLYGQEVAVSSKSEENTIRFVTADTLNADAGTSNDKWPDVTVIKIGLLLASTDPVLATADTNVYQVMDQAIGPQDTTITYADDRRLRRVVNMSINVRNRRVEK